MAYIVKYKDQQWGPFDSASGAAAWAIKHLSAPVNWIIVPIKRVKR